LVPLAAVGPGAAEVLIPLLRDKSFDTRLRAVRVIALRSRYDFNETPLWESVRRLLDDPDAEIRFTGFIVMGVNPYARPRSVGLRALKDPSELVQRGGMVMAPDIPMVDRKDVPPPNSAVIRFVLAWVAEMPLRGRDGKHVPERPSPEELERRLAVDRALRLAGREALAECIELKDRARTPAEQYCVMRCLAFISPAVRSEYGKVLKTLRALPVEPGSMLEQIIKRWPDQIPPEDESYPMSMGIFVWRPIRDL
jgi:hypothetical protein